MYLRTGKANQANKLSLDLKESLENCKVLKFKNEEAYVYGDTQLIYFSDVRECIKKDEEIDLVLIDAQLDRFKIPNLGENRRDDPVQFSINEQVQKFPPIINTLHLERELMVKHEML